jgi:hypothetical protein
VAISAQALNKIKEIKKVKVRFLGKGDRMLDL